MKYISDNTNKQSEKNEIEVVKTSSLHHSFDVDLAIELQSMELATLCHHFQYWINKNAALGKNFNEGRTWTYQTLEELKAIFPYWSRDQIDRLLRKAVKLNIIIKGNFNKSPYDRTCWYAFSDEKRFNISRNSEIDLAISRNQFDETATPIPDKKTNKKTYSITNTLTNTDRIEVSPTRTRVHIDKDSLSNAHFVGVLPKKPIPVASDGLPSLKLSAQEKDTLIKQAVESGLSMPDSQSLVDKVIEDYRLECGANQAMHEKPYWALRKWLTHRLREDKKNPKKKTSSKTPSYSPFPRDMPVIDFSNEGDLGQKLDEMFPTEN